MKLLIDNALSPTIVSPLQDEGHDVVHVRDLNKQAASDEEILRIAEEQVRVIVSADTDFGALLALRRMSNPSFILFRKTTGVRPAEIATQLSEIISDYSEDIEQGCVLTVSSNRVRIRRLPIS